MGLPIDEPSGRSPRRPYQFSIRTLFVLTTVVALIYACLNWFGVMAHVAVWVAFLLGGPVLGLIVAVKRLKETDPIVNSVQGGALGGGSGFLIALLLLAPAYLSLPLEFLCTLAIAGTVTAFTLGGVLGFAVGIVRSLVRWARLNF